MDQHTCHRLHAVNHMCMSLAAGACAQYVLWVGWWVGGWVGGWVVGEADATDSAVRGGGGGRRVQRSVEHRPDHLGGAIAAAAGNGGLKGQGEK
jgi:hypothetical protein